MDLLSNIFGAIKNVGGIIFSWMTGYSSKENTKAREISSDNEKIDEFHDALKEKDIDRTRRDLSD